MRFTCSLTGRQTSRSLIDRKWIGGLVLLCLAGGCRRQEVVPERFTPSVAHKAYLMGLQQTGLAASAMGRDWIAAANRALDSPLEIDIPFRESLYVDPSRPEAFGFLFSTRRGQIIKIQVQESLDPELELFIDVFRAEAEAGKFRLIASAPRRDYQAQFEPQEDGPYILRVQPELLRGGRFTLSVITQPAFDFPVQGRTTSAVLSTFGMPRDAGRRSHQGVDIFAPRHTPVLAPVRAYVGRVGENDLGGNVVWLVDPVRKLNLYFAHLQEQKVEEGRWVEAGELIGTVGNSGNARTTSTHLHFGVYRRRAGAVDPYYYLHRMNGEPPPVEADVTRLGSWVRPQANPARVREKASREGSVLLEVTAATPLFIVGASRDYFKVRLPDGRVGYAESGGLGLDASPLDQLTLSQDSDLFRDPLPDGMAIGVVGAGSRVSVLGKYEEFRLIEEPGRVAWLRGSDTATTGVEKED